MSLPRRATSPTEGTAACPPFAKVCQLEMMCTRLYKTFQFTAEHNLLQNICGCLTYMAVCDRETRSPLVNNRSTFPLIS